MELVALQLEAVLGEGIEIGNIRVHPQLGRLVGGAGDDLLHHRHMAVVDVSVGDDVDQLAGLQTGHPGHHVNQGGVLHHVPAVGGEHILAALVEDGVEGSAADIEGHGVGAGIEGHLVEVVVVVEVGHNTPGGRVVFEIVQHPIHLVEHPLDILVLDPQLIAVGLADGAALVGPGVPDMAVQVVDVVGFLLPDPQQLVHRALEGHFPDGLDGELLPQVVAVDDTEFLHGVGGGAVLPPGAHLLIGVPHPMGQNILTILNKQFICVAQLGSSSLVSRL